MNSLNEKMAGVRLAVYAMSAELKSELVALSHFKARKKRQTPQAQGKIPKHSNKRKRSNSRYTHNTPTSFQFNPHVAYRIIVVDSLRFPLLVFRLLFQINISPRPAHLESKLASRFIEVVEER